MLCQAASKINIKTKIYCDDKNAPAQNYSDEFIYGAYNDDDKIKEFANQVDVVTFEFENIPVPTLEKIKSENQSTLILILILLFKIEVGRKNLSIILV